MRRLWFGGSVGLFGDEFSGQRRQSIRQYLNEPCFYEAHIKLLKCLYWEAVAGCIVSLLSQILRCPGMVFTALHTNDPISEELLSEKILWQVCGGLMHAGREIVIFCFP